MPFLSYCPPSLGRVRDRAHAAGIRGHLGGWIRMPASPGFPAGRSIQGWDAVFSWACRVVEAGLPWNLAEILEGRRVGIPTLRTTDPQELAVGLLCRSNVSWRG